MKTILSTLLLLSLFNFVKGTLWTLSLAASGMNSGEDAICTAPSLTASQREYCYSNEDSVFSSVETVAVAVQECQRQFSQRKWNCSASVDHHDDFLVSTSRDTPETAFTQAIVSAAYVSVIARKCKQQSLRKCSCDSTPKTRPADGSFFWGGCGDNFEYGYRFTKELGDRAFVGLERDLEPSELMIQHNFEAGRKAVEENLQIRCRCHGLSGSCSLKTCWVSLPLFGNIAQDLVTRYESAIKSTAVKSLGKQSLVPIDSRELPPTVMDLVYLIDPPSYCERNERVGSLGTQGRECQLDNEGLNSCKNLCCNRGYEVREEERTYKCRCRYVHCCYVECDTCIETVSKYYCL